MNAPVKDRGNAAATTDPSAPGLPGERHDRPGEASEPYTRAFSVVAFAMNRFIVDHMLRASRMFEGDVETMILFGVLSHLNVAHIVPPGTRPSDALDDAGMVPGDLQPMLRPIRLRDLVIVTGRPRESIRRRLERLHATGRVLKVADGWVLNLASVDDALRAATIDGVKRFLATASVIDAALEDAARALDGTAVPDGHRARPTARAAGRR
jgi:hypothetical protein